MHAPTAQLPIRHEIPWSVRWCSHNLWKSLCMVTPNQHYHINPMTYRTYLDFKEPRSSAILYVISIIWMYTVSQIFKWWKFHSRWGNIGKRQDLDSASHLCGLPRSLGVSPSSCVEKEDHRRTPWACTEGETGFRTSEQPFCWKVMLVSPEEQMDRPLISKRWEELAFPHSY